MDVETVTQAVTACEAVKEAAGITEGEIVKWAMVALFSLFLLYVARQLYRLDQDESVKFRFRNMILDSHGDVAPEKIIMWIGVACCAWGFMYMILRNRMTDGIFVGFMFVTILPRAAAIMFTKNPPPIAFQSTVTEKTETVKVPGKPSDVGD